jgi:protein phosphatase 1 regulatory subunit 7
MIKDFCVQDPQIIDEQLINDKLRDDYKVRVQFSEPIYSEKILSQLNGLALSYDSNFQIRFYAHHRTGFDCKTLEYIPNVKSLSLDCLTRAQNVDELKQLKFLEKVGIGIFELDSLDILSYDNLKKVNRLSILDTKSKALNLEFLSDYNNLIDLQIAGHTKNINAIANLKQLDTLTLHSIRKVPLSFINSLKSLKTLRIILGGRDNINEIEENNIENLELIWIRGLNDLSALKSFKHLKELRIQDEIKLKEIHFSKSNFLQDVQIFNCKALQKISGLENLVSLSNLRIGGTSVDFDDFLDNSAFPEKLKTIDFYTWKVKRDNEIRKRLDMRGFQESIRD